MMLAGMARSLGPKAQISSLGALGHICVSLDLLATLRMLSVVLVEESELVCLQGACLLHLSCPMVFARRIHVGLVSGIFTVLRTCLAPNDDNFAVLVDHAHWKHRCQFLLHP